MKGSDALFGGSIPDIYDRCLGPLFFQPFAMDLAQRAKQLGGRYVLEVAAGTGIATRALAAQLPNARIEATDLDGSMVARAFRVSKSHNVVWSVADAMALPFRNGNFDLAVCQFGVMFFPERLQGLREIRRVLSPGGIFLFSVWDDLKHNDVARIVAQTVADAFPENPPNFLARVPHGHGDTHAMEGDLRAAGFTRIRWEAIEQHSGRVSPRDAAVGLCEGTPMKREIVERDSDRLNEIVESATRNLKEAFGPREVGGKTRAFIFTAG